MTKPDDLREELAPCPFCGCHEINLVKHKGAGRGFDHAGDDVWTIGCNNCGASVPGRYNEHGKTLLIAAWNKRAPDPRIARVRAEERERCAHIVESINLGNVAMPDLPSLKGVSPQAQLGLLSEFALLAREKIAAAIRGRK